MGLLSTFLFLENIDSNFERGDKNLLHLYLSITYTFPVLQILQNSFSYNNIFDSNTAP